MTWFRAAALVNFAVRIAYGATMLAAPERIGRTWLGAEDDGAQTDVPLRSIGGREVAVHVAAAVAAASGAPVRPWLLASLGGDLTDIVTTVGQRRGLPRGSVTATALTGGGSAVISAALFAGLDS